VWAVAGALALVCLGLLSPSAALEGVHKGLDVYLFLVGMMLLACALVYLIPRTAILGAILLTGFLGGAVAIQMRAGSPTFETVFPVLFAIMVWGGVYLRERRLCTLVPLRRC